MSSLSSHGQSIVNDLSQRYGFSPDAVTHMLFAVLNGNGGMAQFGHPEFGGSGQWMRGGMLMLGDMFNHGLKSRVDALCNELATLLIQQPGLLRGGSFQSQSQGGDAGQHQVAGGYHGESSLFVPDPTRHWWPRELGAPTATGRQNTLQYAYFADARRLAVNTGGDVWVYDTLDHQIGGFAQQQGPGGSISFSSQYGTIDLTRLPVVLRNGQPPPQSAPAAPPESLAPALNYPPAPPSDAILTALERLGDLKAKGIVTDAEFAAKKAELLARL